MKCLIYHFIILVSKKVYIEVKGKMAKSCDVVEENHVSRMNTLLISYDKRLFVAQRQCSGNFLFSSAVKPMLTNGIKTTFSSPTQSK